MKPPGLRVVSGRLKNRRLAAPKGLETRPSLEKNRSLIFDVLSARLDLSRYAAADCFAGSGALGIEAYSRGAEPLVCCETSAPTRRVLQENLQSLLPPDSFLLFKGDGLKWLASFQAGERPWLFLLDPPYGRGLGGSALERLSERADELKGSVVVLENAKADEPGEYTGLERFSEKLTGKSRLDFFWIG